MPETMLQRLIQVAEQELIGHVDPTSATLSEYGIAAKLVPALLTAMREPGDAAICVGGSSVQQSLAREGMFVNGIARDAWRAMIDAALAEQG